MNFEDIFNKKKIIKEPYIAAEIGSNFDQSLDKAYKMIKKKYFNL
jgi:sialic acid synthase SpsE